jgi:hemerythrin-like domain-containing protein
MSEPMRRLHEDHASLLRLLAMLERQIEVMAGGGRPDWDIVQGVVDYLLTYPDLRHHPLEDRVLARLQVKDPAAAAPFLGLEAEHREQGANLRRIAAATALLLQDTTMAKEAYLDLLRHFLVEQRDHIRREETGFLPAAERILDERDLLELDGAPPPLPDPLGDPADRQFRFLRLRLARWDAADLRDRRGDGT